MEARFSLRSYQPESIRHSHAVYHQIIYPISGSLHLDIGQGRGLVHRYMFGQIEANVEHEYYSQGDNKFLVIDLPCILANRITAEITERRIDTFHIGTKIFRETDEQLHSIFQLIYLHMSENDESCMMRDALTRCFLGSLALRQNFPREKEDQSSYRKEVMVAIEFIHAHYAEDFTIQTLANVVGMGVSHFHRVFAGQTGKTPLEYVTRHRVAAAAKKLQDTTQPILDICMAVGYQSPATFSRLFRRYYGCSPSEYRRIGQK
jgi:AraC-like DNA-binding protein